MVLAQGSTSPRVTLELSAQVHHDLIAYGELLGAQAGHAAIEPAKLIGPMLLRFMATDRVFLKARRPCGAPGREST